MWNHSQTFSVAVLACTYLMWHTQIQVWGDQFDKEDRVQLNSPLTDTSLKPEMLAAAKSGIFAFSQREVLQPALPSFFILLLSTAQFPSYGTLLFHGSAQCLFYVMTARQGSFPISIHLTFSRWSLTTYGSHQLPDTSQVQKAELCQRTILVFKPAVPYMLRKCCLQDWLLNTWRWHCYLAFHLNSCLLQISITVKSWHCSVPHICTTAHLLLCYYSHFIRRCLVINTNWLAY